MWYKDAMTTIWAVKKVPTFPKEYKVYPSNRPAHWETNSPDNFFVDYQSAVVEAEKRNKAEKSP